MKIPHLTRNGTFRPQMRTQLAALSDCDFVQISLSPTGGYKGAMDVTIGKRSEDEFEAEVELSDPSRFPARIRAACTELRDQGYTGSFRITNDDGILTISRV